MRSKSWLDRVAVLGGVVALAAEDGNGLSQRERMLQMMRRTGSRRRRAEVVIRLRLFASSYAILFLISAIRFDHTVLRISLFVFFAYGVVDAWFLTRYAQTKTPEAQVIKDCRDAGAEVAGYLASYLLPFVTTSDPSLADLAGYGMYLAVIALVFIRSDMAQVNPTLYALGWVVHRADVEMKGDVLVIARHRPQVGDKLHFVELADVLVATQEGATERAA